MLNDLSIVTEAGRMARFAAARHSVISENIAQADVPGYKARDMPAFAAFAARGADATMPKATRQGHMTQPIAQVLPQASETDDPVAPNGNSVVIEEQSMLAAEAAGQHRLALSVYSKTLDLLRLGLGRLR
ncbi:MAG: flagellar basal body rod protein FlgB [Pseudomonadota bacterium]